MAFSYQRKQTILIAIICIIVIIVAAIYTYWPILENNIRKQDTKSLTSTPQATNENIIPIASSTNWQKDFYTVSSSTTAYKTIDSPTTSVDTEPLSNTDIMGREFFVAYTQLQQAGKTNDNTAVSSVANQVIANAAARLPTPKTYRLSDLNISNSSDLAALQKYATTLSNILQNEMPKQNEVNIVSNAVDSGDMTILKQLDPVISSYKVSLHDLLAMPVPQSLSSYHLRLVNGVNLQLFSTQSFTTMSTDPVSSLSAIDMETQALNQTSGAIDDLRALLIASGVINAY